MWLLLNWWRKGSLFLPVSCWADAGLGKDIVLWCAEALAVWVTVLSLTEWGEGEMNNEMVSWTKERMIVIWFIITLSWTYEWCFKSMADLEFKFMVNGIYSVPCTLGIGTGCLSQKRVAWWCQLQCHCQALSCWACQAHNPTGTSVGGCCPHFMVEETGLESWSNLPEVIKLATGEDLGQVLGLQNHASS